MLKAMVTEEFYWQSRSY